MKYLSARIMRQDNVNIIKHEMDREDMKHHIVLLLTEGRLHLAPINPKAEKILDIGTGTGKKTIFD
jgi:ubiquinone/menaquinone biosynthesis C-methylase UbiE